MLELRQVEKSYPQGGKMVAALVAVGGIVTTSIFARRREWAVLRAMGIGNAGLLAVLALETFLVMAIGTLAAALPAWLTARAPLADALSYE